MGCSSSVAASGDQKTRKKKEQKDESFEDDEPEDLEEEDNDAADAAALAAVPIVRQSLAMLETSEAIYDDVIARDEGSGQGGVDPKSPDFCSHMATHQHCWSDERVCLGCGATRNKDGEITRHTKH